MMTIDSESLVYLGIGGNVIALDRLTGAEIWRTRLRGRGFVNLVLEGDALLAAAAGEVFCLDPISGGIRWHNPLRGMGLGLVTFAGTNIAAMAQKRMNDEASNAAVASSVAITH
jgi:outer membrane protein assembly factor BamB